MAPTLTTLAEVRVGYTCRVVVGSDRPMLRVLFILAVLCVAVAFVPRMQRANTKQVGVAEGRGTLVVHFCAWMTIFAMIREIYGVVSPSMLFGSRYLLFHDEKT